jgi:hypothetical protein
MAATALTAMSGGTVAPDGGQGAAEGRDQVAGALA